jgi:hypothetical protein
MNRLTALLLVAIAAAIGGYLYWNAQQVTAPPAEAPAPEAAPAVPEAAPATPEPAPATPEAPPATPEAAAPVPSQAGAPDPALLTSEGFDAEALVAAIAASGLEPAQKQALTQAIEAGRDNAALRDLAIAQVRAAFGL